MLPNALEPGLAPNSLLPLTSLIIMLCSGVCPSYFVPNTAGELGARALAPPLNGPSVMPAACPSLNGPPGVPTASEAVVEEGVANTGVLELEETAGP
jgi:hypothetical protein